MLPSPRIFPLISSIPLIEIFITKYAITAERADTSFSFFAIPMATPTANNSGRLSNTALPTLFMMTKSACRIVPSPRIFPKWYVAIVVSFVNELPSPRSNPATGRIAIGSIKLRPILCRTSKILSFMIHPSFPGDIHVIICFVCISFLVSAFCPILYSVPGIYAVILTKREQKKALTHINIL